MEPAQSDIDRLQPIHELLDEGALDEVAKAFDALHPAEIGHFLESLPVDDRLTAWGLVAEDVRGDVLPFVYDEVRTGLIKRMDEKSLLAAVEGLDTDDLADILPDLPEAVISSLLRAMDEQDRHRLEAVLKYPEDTAGGLMNVDSVTVRPHVTLDVVLRYLRFRGDIPDMTDNLIVVNREDKFLGTIMLTDIVTKEPSLTVAELMHTEIPAIPVDMRSNEVANMFEKFDLVSAPVVDENGKLVGRITIDDVVDVMREAADHSFLGRAGLDEEDDMFAPVVRSSRRRAVWLGFNLLTAFLASWVIGLFEATIQQLVALAVLMPVVASMGGIAGSQTLTLVIRGMALGHISKANQMLLLRKELSIGAVNGVLWSVVIGVVAFWWFESVQLGLVIALAIMCNLVVAALAGASIPMLLRRYGADPALAGSVVLTTVTDVVGFFVFLGMASIFLV